MSWLLLLHNFIQLSRFCAGSNPACDKLKIYDGEDLRQWSQLEIWLNAFCLSNIPLKQFIIIFIKINLGCYSTANKYYCSASHHEQKNKKTNGQIKFSAVTIKQQIKLTLQHSLCK